MTYPTYKFQRGEPIIIGRQVVSGDPAGYAVSASLKPTRGQVVPSASVPATAQFVVSFQPATVDQAAHWLLTLDATASAALAPGQYVTDVRFTRDGETVQITEPAFVLVSESVSG